MRSALRHFAARAITRGRFAAFEEEIGHAVSQDHGEADPERVAAIIEWTLDTVPYYEHLASNVSSLQDLPVIDKVTIKSDPDSFLMRSVDKSSLTARSTSGSTGIPFTVYLDTPRVHRNKAGAAALLKYAGADAFGPILRAKQWGKLTLAERLGHFAKEYYAAHADRFRSTDAAPIAAWLKRRKGSSIQGYPSYLEMIFRALEEKDVRFQHGMVQAIISAAEAPTPYFFDAARRLFGVQAHARYSNMELGAMSISSPTASDVYKFDYSSFQVEILEEDSDKPAQAGELGRIVVTDLHNRAMPLLRYDTGDLGRFAVTSGGKTAPNLITDLHGRRLDILVAGTPSLPRRVHALAVWGPAAQISEIRQFQLRQHAVGKFSWILNAERSSLIEEKLRSTLNERVGNISECNFRYVSELPVLASGKRQFFVSEIEDPLEYIAART